MKGYSQSSYARNDCSGQAKEAFAQAVMLFTLRLDALRENCPEAYVGMTELLESLGCAPEAPG